MLRSILLLVLLPIAMLVHAQEHKAGGFGYFSTGPVITDLAVLQRDLQRPELLGTSITLDGFGWSFGGGGLNMAPFGLLIGGSGFGVQYSSINQAEADVRMTGGAGFFEIGYAVVRRNGWIIYPLLGFGGSSMQLEITNRTARTLPLANMHQLAPSHRGRYSIGGFAAEAAIGMKRFLFTDAARSGGIVIGLDIGAWFVPASDGWTYIGSGEGVHALTTDRSPNYFVRLTFGGGGFDKAVE
jgi:hypothetical protein